jgi:ubiquinone/menaquinone biosynthesis C-methylase UbiE
MDEDRLKNEADFHDKRFGAEKDSRDCVSKYHAVNYIAMDCYSRIIEGVCKGKRLLEYGCGMGGRTRQWLRAGAMVTGIDISPEGIKKAQNDLKSSGENAELLVMNAESMDFAGSTFDVVVGAGIIHHLDLDKAYPEIARVLKSDGHAVFVEPLGHNPAINFYRWMTPGIRTPDEHPLLMKDLRRLREVFKTVDLHYFTMTSLLSVPFRNTGGFNVICRSLNSLDQLIWRIPFLRRYAWVVVIHCSQPVKS